MHVVDNACFLQDVGGQAHTRTTNSRHGRKMSDSTRSWLIRSQRARRCSISWTRLQTAIFATSDHAAPLKYGSIQDFFNSFSPRLAPKTIRNMHACLRTVLTQGKTWGLVRVNPAQGVRLPRKKARKPPVLLAKQDIRRVIDALPEPTKSIITLMVVGSLRIGEVTALGWERIQPDGIEIVERFYEGEFDDTKTDAGRRSIPLDFHGILRAVLDGTWQRSKHRKPGDLVFTNAKGGPVNRRNLLRRHLKPTIKKLGLPATVGFRSFRTMHSSLMSSAGVRPEVTRDNMGHATVDVTQNVYNRTWWEERVEAVSLAAASVWREFTPGHQPARQCKPFCVSPHDPAISQVFEKI